MSTVDRLGIHIDQCDGCRGIFLDRGELEQVLNAEQRHYAPAAPPPPYQGGPVPMPGTPYPPQPGYGQPGYRDSPPGYAKGGHRDSAPGFGSHGGYRDSPSGYGSHGSHGHQKRRKGFLEQLFD